MFSLRKCNYYIQLKIEHLIIVFFENCEVQLSFALSIGELVMFAYSLPVCFRYEERQKEGKNAKI